VTAAKYLMEIPPDVPDKTGFPVPDRRAAVIAKVVKVAPAGTVTDGAAIDRSALLLDSEIVVPPAGAALFKLTVHFALAPAAKSVGLHDSEERTCADTKLIAAVCVAPFKVAKSWAVWSPVTLPAVALKVVVAEPAGTVSVDPGMGNSALLLAMEMAVPPAGAALLRVTVHIAVAPDAKSEGVHVSEESVIVDTRLSVVVCDAPFQLAKSLAVPSLAMLPAVAWKVVVAEPAGTMIVAERPGSSE
jgi:hypothetical protein